MLTAARNNRGRGRGSSNGRASQRSFGHGSNTSSKKLDDKSKLKKFHPQIRGRYPEFSFDEVKKELIKSMEAIDLEKADDILDSIRDMQLMDLAVLEPTLTMSTATTRAEREEENERIREEHRIQTKRWESRVDAMANNKRKLHAKIFKFCTKEMVDKLDREPDIETTLYRNPIDLLKRIRKFMETSEETDWEYFGLWEALTKLVNCRQAGNETPNDFRRKFEERSKTVLALLGNAFLNEFAGNTTGYRSLPGTAVPGIESDQQTQYRNDAWEMLLASGMIFNSDRSRYQSRIDTMNSAYMIVHQPYAQRMTYPLTLHNATETLNRHKPDNRKSKNVKNVNGVVNSNRTSRAGNRNASNVESNNGDSGTNLAQVGGSGSGRACYCCGASDHVAPECPDRYKPKARWVKPDKWKDYASIEARRGNGSRNRSMLQTDNATHNGDDSARNEQSNVQWSFMQTKVHRVRKDPPKIPGHLTLGQVVTDDDDDSFIQVEAITDDDTFEHRLKMGTHMDSGSTFRLIAGQENAVPGTIRKLTKPFNYGCNIGSRDLHVEGESKIFPNNYGNIDDKAKASVESTSLLVREGFDVIFDSRVYNGFIVHKDGMIWHFPERGGLYTLMPDDICHERNRVTDPAGMKLLWEQHKRVAAIDDLLVVDPDPHLELLLEREQKIYNMIANDLQRGNPTEWVMDMVERLRFGLSPLKQKDFLGGKIRTKDDMRKVLRKIYDGIPAEYDGGVRDWLKHDKIERELVDEIRFYSEYYPDVATLKKPPRSIPLPDPFEIIQEFNDSKAEWAKRLKRDNTSSNNDKHSSSGYCAVQSVMKNVEGFTSRQVERANKARAGYHMAGAPGLEAFKLAVRTGLFKNCPIEESDVVVAQKIYGPSVAAIKGKTKRPTPEPVVDTYIAIPPELIANIDLDLAIDLMFVNNVVALTGVDTSVKYRHFVELNNRTKQALYSGIDEIFRVYNHGGFNIRTILCDQEFKPVFEPVKDELNIHMNYASAGEHEPTAERNNQHLKSLMRTFFHRTPYKAVPKLLTIAMGRRAAKTANFYPAKGGISEYYSPYMIILKRQVDYSKECMAETGAYVQAYGHETHRNQRTRTLDAIYLYPAPNTQTGHLLMDLNTGKLIQRNKIKVLPVTKQVIGMVEQLARDEGVTSLRTYSRRTGAVILDADLLAGVEPDDIWDDDYDPDDDTPPKTSDENLRNERIDEEEVNDLIDDLGDDEFVDVQNSDDEYEDIVTSRIIERMKQRDQNTDNDDNDEEEEYANMPKMVERIQHPRATAPTQEDKNEMLEDLANELKQLESDEKSEEIIFIDDDDEENDEEYEDMPDLIQSKNVGGYDSDSDSDDESDDEKKNQDIVYEKRKTRSGKAYWQNGTKMRPSIRNGFKRLKFNAYHKSPKKKPNNRTAMRHKQKKKHHEMRVKTLRKELRKELRALKMIRMKHDALRRQIAKDEQNVRNQAERIHNIFYQQTDGGQTNTYARDNALMLARIIQHTKNRVMHDGVAFIQQYYITKGLKKFGADGRKAAMKELQQMLERNCWTPVLVSKLSPEERRKAVDSMMLLAEKNDGTIKGRHVYQGSQTRDWMTREETASPTASLEAITTTCVIDAFEGRDIMTCDIPNAFIQTAIPNVKEGEARMTMKITGIVVDYLVALDPNYRKYVVMEGKRRVIYVVLLRAIYGATVSSLLWYKKLRGDLEKEDFVFNPYDPCIANRMVKGNQQTIRFHVDDVMSSHIDPKVNDMFYKWLDSTYGKFKKVTCHRGDQHVYLGMTLDFAMKGSVKIRMDDYVDRMLDEFPVKFKAGERQETPAGANLLEPGKGAPLDPKRKEIFHSFVAKALFLSKRARLDIAPTVAILASRVQAPVQGDWHRLVRMMRYLHSTRGFHVTLSADDIRVFKWYIDAAFATHPDFKSHTGSTLTMGVGAMQIMSRKQKMNSRSSTEAELIGVDDAITQVLWTKLFMEAQGYPVRKNVIYQDNKSSILLETNGRSSAGKRSRALNIRYFFVTDQVELGNVTIEYMPTDEMWADFMTKPLQGEKFRKFRALILGMPN